MNACVSSRLVLSALLGLGLAACASADHPGSAAHAHAASDSREAVSFPPALYDHTLGSMRDHLATLQQLQAALADAQYDAAARMAEERLGLTSLPLHGAHDVAPYMPRPMQQMGTEMHRAASRFAVEAANASATGDVKPALAALSTLTSKCVSCHEAYRLARM